MTAQQIPDRRVERLAFDVPERHLDGGQRAAAHDAGHAVAHHGQIELLPHFFDLHGIFANQQRRQIFDRRLHNTGPAAALANAIDAFVGEDLDKEPVACIPATAAGSGIHQIRLDLCDFHGLVLCFVR